MNEKKAPIEAKKALTEAEKGLIRRRFGLRARIIEMIRKGLIAS